MLRAGLVSFAITVVATAVVTVALRRWRVLDVPNQRSSHSVPTPRGGGLGVAAGVLVAICVAPQLNSPLRVALIVAGVTFGVLGLFEDLVGIPALARLALMFVAAAATVPWLTDDLTGSVAWRGAFTIGVLLWLVSYVNAFNFMDGIDGLSGGQALVAGVAWYLIGQAEGVDVLAVIGVVIAAAALGFLPFNLPKAHVFLGDVGSYFLGAVLACGAVVGLRSGLPPEAVLAPLALYVADTGFTLARRVQRGECWYAPHRIHVYQALTVLLGRGHVPVTILVVALMSACAALGALSLVSTPARVAGDAGIVVLLLAYCATPTTVVRVRRRQPALSP